MSKTASSPLPMGTVLLQYRIEQLLGQGGFGVTYLAKDTKLNVQVAIKEYFHQGLCRRLPDGSVQQQSADDGGMFLRGMDRFLQEARTLASFRHSNIISVLNFFEANQTAYMVMTYEEGESLSARIKGRKTLSEEALRAIALPLLDGLALLHRDGFIHRDIKPANIYIRTDGVPVLLDFGSARTH